MNDSHDIDVEGVRRYLLGRRTPEGGFCFYRYGPWKVEEPNAPDTWAALASLRHLGAALPSPERTVAWLRGQQAADGGFQSLLIGEAVLSALGLLQAEPMYDPRRFIQAWAERVSRSNTQAGDIEAWLHGVQRCIRLLISMELPLAPLRTAVTTRLSSLRGSLDAHPSTAPTLLATGRALDILVRFQEPPGTALMFLRRCEDPKLGLTLVPGSSATWLEVHQVGLRALRSLGEFPRFPDAIRTFARRCQGTEGGFSRVPGALPNLRDTWLALSILDHLDALG